jgi:phage baseplate assembly protein W
MPQPPDNQADNQDNNQADEPASGNGRRGEVVAADSHARDALVPLPSARLEALQAQRDVRAPSNDPLARMRALAIEPSVPSFVGRGFSFPMGVNTDGGIRMTRGPEDLDASMRVILSTAPGERLMRPQFGCRIWDLIFEPVNFNTLGQMAEAAGEAIAQWEPRVDVLGIECVPDSLDPYLVNIDITYRVRATNDRRNLVYPFYVIPREEH